MTGSNRTGRDMGSAATWLSLNGASPNEAQPPWKPRRRFSSRPMGGLKAADLAVTNPYWNPRPLERGAIRDLIAHAWAGEPPQVAPPSA